MKMKEDLLGLIQSLSMSEKRYFKLFVAKNSIGESSHYLKLFDLINKSGNVDKKVIQKLYGDNDFMEKQFLEYKYRLYKQILKSLRSYYSEKSVDDKIMELIRDAKILVNKSLYPDATKILKKAKTIASKYEKHTLILEIIRWQKKIVNVWSIHEKPDQKEAIDVFEEEKLTINKIDNANNYWKQHALMYLSYRINGVARTQEVVELHKAIVDVPSLKNQELALSFQAKKNFYATWQLYFVIINNLKESYEYSKKEVALMEAHPHQIEDNAVLYNQAQHNLLFNLHTRKKYDELFMLLPKFKLMLRRFQLPLSVLIRSYNLEFEIYVETGQYKKATLLLAKIEALIKEQKDKKELNELFFIVSKSYLYFGCGDYRKALTNINLVLNEKRTQVSLEHDIFIRVFHLIIHFEKGNIGLLPYLLKSLYRYLMQKKQLHKMERIFMKFIGSSLNKKKIKNYIEDFKLLREELLNISNNPMEETFLNHIDVISWLESKIDNRPFGEILREKSGCALEEEMD